LAFYRNSFPPNSAIPADLVAHYLERGWLEGRDPNTWFSTLYYLEKSQDVAKAGLQPFVHYLTIGLQEAREIYPPKVSASQQAVFEEHSRFTSVGAEFEIFDPSIVDRRKINSKALAFYLPQFHPIKENDEWWGAGFTEWRNCVRGQPRFKGHHQPRIPRDLGFYDLRRLEIMREQVALAKGSGIYGFCFYYYSFNGERLLDGPIEAFLTAPDINMPFALIWANENWTRTWDGLDRDIMKSQDYREGDEGVLLADLARHFADPRYIRIGNRPLFFLYRPGIIPHSKTTIHRWRDRWRTEYGLDPLIFMVQAFDDDDPREHGLDGAMEFPPHKVSAGLPAINSSIELLDPSFCGHVVSYDAVIRRSLDEPKPDFPLIKAVTTCWDNEARRPGRGMVLHGASPRKYESWLREIVKQSRVNPIYGESFVAINAWNEWAEGAYLEPDVYYGAAYLNATARALTATPDESAIQKDKVLIVGHDAHPHGAQYLLKNIVAIIARKFGVEVHVLVCGEGPLLADYRKIAECSTVAPGNETQLSRVVTDLASRGFRRAIVNTTVSGWVIPTLKAEGFQVVALVHELGTLIRDYSLEANAATIARSADYIFFPAEMVRDEFLSISGPPNGNIIIRPQGHYLNDIGTIDRSASSVRAKLGIPESTKLVINVAYADSRKGFDIFARVAREVAAHRADVSFVWVGDGTPDVKHWYLPESRSGIMENRFFFTGHVSNLPQYYAAADLFLLTSREDPFPAVVLAAIAAGLPIVGFVGASGTADLISHHGRLVDRADLKGIVSAIDGLLDLPAREKTRMAAQGRRAVAEKYQFDAYCYNLLQRLSHGLATVSVVVPNHNYSDCLRDRLESIFAQLHPVFEVIVLDDKSTDNSTSVIRKIAADARRDVDLVVNEKNSGSAFRQWCLGVERARGDYVWIAEADDIAKPTFLNSLVEAMQRSNASIAFCDSWQIDIKGGLLGYSYKNHINQIVPGAFDRSFSMPGREFYERFLSVKNVILNVSGVLWRRDALSEALSKLGEDLFQYQVAGDWRMYAEICQLGGSVAYVSDALNGHRRHISSVTHALSKQRHYDEIISLQRLTARGRKLSRESLIARAAHRAEVRQVLGLEGQSDVDPAETAEHSSGLRS
jgi:glycosyltransferase involved in cell wall biosynthesis